MSKPISNSKFRSIIKSMPAEKQRESLERSLRTLPIFIQEEIDNPHPAGSSPKVIKHLKSRLKCAQNLWMEFLIENHA
tara:strand:+ start:1257 stop:1490 length:234 start_codon:yes stop_codon:yes gene_type:complete